MHKDERDEDVILWEFIEELTAQLSRPPAGPRPPRNLRLPEAMSDKLVEELYSNYPSYNLAIQLLREGPSRWLEELLEEFEDHPDISRWHAQLVLRGERFSSTGPEIDVPRIAWALVCRNVAEARQDPDLEVLLDELRLSGVDDRVALVLSFVPEDLLGRLHSFRTITTESRQSEEYQRGRQRIRNPLTPDRDAYWQRRMAKFELIHGRSPRPEERQAMERQILRPAFTPTEWRRFFANLGLDHRFPSEPSKFTALQLIVFVPLWWYFERQRFFASSRRRPAGWASRLVAARTTLWNDTGSAVKRLQALLNTPPRRFPPALHPWQRARTAPEGTMARPWLRYEIPPPLL